MQIIRLMGTAAILGIVSCGTSQNNENHSSQIDDAVSRVNNPARPDLPVAGGYEAWRENLLEQIRVRCFGAWPLSYRPKESAEFPGAFEPESGVRVTWKVWLNPEARRLSWLIVLDPRDSEHRLPEWAVPSVTDSHAVLFHPRQTSLPQNSPGQTVDSGRVWDVMDGARRHNGGGLQVAGRGESGIIAAYAALYEPSITAVTIVDPPSSHQEGPHFMGVLGICDIPEALGCLAPRRLTIIGGRREAFDRTAELYRLAGASDKLLRK